MIFPILDKIRPSGHDAYIEWVCHQDDEDILDPGWEYQKGMSSHLLSMRSVTKEQKICSKRIRAL